MRSIWQQFLATKGDETCLRLAHLCYMEMDHTHKSGLSSRPCEILISDKQVVDEHSKTLGIRLHAYLFFTQFLSTMKWAACKTVAICLQGKIWYIICTMYSPVYGSSDPVFFEWFYSDISDGKKNWYGKFPGLKHPRWLFGISCVHSITVSLSPSIFIAMKAWPCLASLKGKASELHGLAHGCLSEHYGGRTTF